MPSASDGASRSVRVIMSVACGLLNDFSDHVCASALRTPGYASVTPVVGPDRYGIPSQRYISHLAGRNGGVGGIRTFGRAGTRLSSHDMENSGKQPYRTFLRLPLSTRVHQNRREPLGLTLGSAAGERRQGGRVGRRTAQAVTPLLRIGEGSGPLLGRGWPVPRDFADGGSTVGIFVQAWRASARTGSGCGGERQRWSRRPRQRS